MHRPTKQLPIYILVYIFLLTFCGCEKKKPTCLSPSFQKTSGTLSPENPSAIREEFFTANCTLHDAENQSNDTDQMYFSIHDQVVPTEHVQVIGPGHIQLKHPSLKHEGPSSVFLCCHFGNGSIVAYEHMKVYYPPPRPIIRHNKITVNNWEELQFSWRLSKDVQLDNHSYRDLEFIAKWKKSSSSSASYQRCPQVEGSQCVVTSEYFDPKERFYLLKVISKGSVSKASSRQEMVDVLTVVKPGPVKDFKVKKATSHNLTLTWKSPKEGKRLLYEVTYFGSWDSQPQVTFLQLSRRSNLQIDLTNLTAFTNYTVSVRSRPVTLYSDSRNITGRWSDSVTEHFMTAHDRPSSSPPVNRGGFQVLENYGLRDVRLFWKELEERNRNDIIAGYVASCRDVVTNVESAVPLIPTATQLWTDIRGLKPSHTHICQVSAKTVHDMISLSPVPIYITSQSQLPTLPNNVTAIALNHTTLQLSWRPQTEHHSVTVFWCLALSPCPNGLDWVETKAVSKSVIIPNLVEGVWAYKFAVSVQTASASSGTQWIPCIYDASKGSVPPEVELSDTTSDSVHLSIKRPKCSRHRGFVYAYRICLRSPDDNTAPCLKELRVLANGSTTEYKVSDLPSQQTVQIDVQSVTVTGLSNVTSQTISLPKGFSWLLVGIIVGSVVLVFVALAVLQIFSTGRKVFSKIFSWLRPSVARPAKDIENMLPADPSLYSGPSHSHQQRHGNSSLPETPSTDCSQQPLLQGYSSSDGDMIEPEAVSDSQSQQQLLNTVNPTEIADYGRIDMASLQKKPIEPTEDKTSTPPDPSLERHNSSSSEASSSSSQNYAQGEIAHLPLCEWVSGEPNAIISSSSSDLSIGQNRFGQKGSPQSVRFEMQNFETDKNLSLVNQTFGNCTSEQNLPCGGSLLPSVHKAPNVEHCSQERLPESCRNPWIADVNFYEKRCNLSIKDNVGDVDKMAMDTLGTSMESNMDDYTQAGLAASLLESDIENYPKVAASCLTEKDYNIEDYPKVEATPSSAEDVNIEDYPRVVVAPSPAEDNIEDYPRVGVTPSSTGDDNIEDYPRVEVTPSSAGEESIEDYPRVGVTPSSAVDDNIEDYPRVGVSPSSTGYKSIEEYPRVRVTPFSAEDDNIEDYPRVGVTPSSAVDDNIEDYPRVGVSPSSTGYKSIEEYPRVRVTPFSAEDDNIEDYPRVGVTPSSAEEDSIEDYPRVRVTSAGDDSIGDYPRAEVSSLIAENDNIEDYPKVGISASSTENYSRVGVTLPSTETDIDDYPSVGVSPSSAEGDNIEDYPRVGVTSSSTEDDNIEDYPRVGVTPSSTEDDNIEDYPRVGVSTSSVEGDNIEDYPRVGVSPSSVEGDNIEDYPRVGVTSSSTEDANIEDYPRVGVTPSSTEDDNIEDYPRVGVSPSSVEGDNIEDYPRVGVTPSSTEDNNIEDYPRVGVSPSSVEGDNIEDYPRVGVTSSSTEDANIEDYPRVGVTPSSTEDDNIEDYPSIGVSSLTADSDSFEEYPRVGVTFSSADSDNVENYPKVGVLSPAADNEDIEAYSRVEAPPPSAECDSENYPTVGEHSVPSTSSDIVNNNAAVASSPSGQGSCDINNCKPDLNPVVAIHIPQAQTSRVSHGPHLDSVTINATAPVQSLTPNSGNHVERNPSSEQSNLPEWDPGYCRTRIVTPHGHQHDSTFIPRWSRRQGCDHSNQNHVPV